MCIIIDANVISLVFNDPPHDDFKPLFSWLFSPNKDGCLVYGGCLADQLNKCSVARRSLLRLNQAGRAVLIPKGEIKKIEMSIVQFCISNDSYIIALARISGARTLCSHDKKLSDDFKNPRLISKPRGSVYKNVKHVDLLKHTRSCGRLRMRG